MSSAAAYKQFFFTREGHRLSPSDLTREQLQAAIAVLDRKIAAFERIDAKEYEYEDYSDGHSDRLVMSMASHHAMKGMLEKELAKKQYQYDKQERIERMFAIDFEGPGIRERLI